jgi:hypothetical protein
MNNLKSKDYGWIVFHVCSGSGACQYDEWLLGECI